MSVQIQQMHKHFLFSYADSVLFQLRLVSETACNGWKVSIMYVHS